MVRKLKGSKRYKLEEHEHLEVRPEYLKKLKKIQKGKYISFKNIKELRNRIEGNKS